MQFYLFRTTLKRFRCHRKSIDRFASTPTFWCVSTVNTKTFENHKIARCDLIWTPCPCYQHTRLRYFRSWFSFWSVVDRPQTTQYVRVFVLIHFKSVFIENAHCSSVDGRAKSIECMRFQTKKTLVRFSLVHKHKHKDIRPRRIANLTQFSIPGLLNPMINKMADEGSAILLLICSHEVWVKVTYDWSMPLCLCLCLRRPRFSPVKATT